MQIKRAAKEKIVNDPVYGFTSLPGGVTSDIIEGALFQRLRHIKQLGLTNYVYPGANHTRFQHSLGALHLMKMAVDTLRRKGVQISDEEEEAVQVAILVHDIGHGPFSHALENVIFDGVPHERLSLLFLERLNRKHSGTLSLAIEIFNSTCNRPFFSELVSGQTDMDRLDYLTRDSFFTGVVEGSVSSDRIIKMLNVADERLVIEEKGTHSIENFLIARRLMYWQVYMHKTVIAAERVLSSIIRRARELTLEGKGLFATPSLRFFLENRPSSADLLATEREQCNTILDHFARIDDNDISVCAREWCDDDDMVLSTLCRSLVYRELPAIELSNEPFGESRIEEMKRNTEKLMNLPAGMVNYFIHSGEVSNRTYAPDDPQVNILLKNGTIKNISAVSDMFDHDSLSQKSIKYFLCYPKILR